VQAGFAGKNDGACLWTFAPLFFYKPDLCADLELNKAGVEHTIPVEIDLSAICSFNEAIVVLRKEFGDAAKWRRFVRVDRPAIVAHIVFELPTHRIKRITDGHV
jgi:hypothetical protein